MPLIGPGKNRNMINTSINEDKECLDHKVYNRFCKGFAMIGMDYLLRRGKSMLKYLLWNNMPWN